LVLFAMSKIANPNRPLIELQNRFIEKIVENPDRPPALSARLAGYSIASAYPVMHKLFKDPRVIAALAAHDIDVLPAEMG
jgi:phage terminase small subunit